jgi:hypothetical protein
VRGWELDISLECPFPVTFSWTPPQPDGSAGAEAQVTNPGLHCQLTENDSNDSKITV